MLLSSHGMSDAVTARACAGRGADAGDAGGVGAAGGDGRGLQPPPPNPSPNSATPYALPTPCPVLTRSGLRPCYALSGTRVVFCCACWY
eukprot:541247-Rhodomonas_salina.2